MEKEVRRPESLVNKIVKKGAGPAMAATLLVTGCRGLTADRVTIVSDQAAARPQPISTATPRPSEAPMVVRPSKAETKEVGCGQAEQLGPWAPSANGTPERFEIDATQEGTTVVATIWIPGLTPQGTEHLMILKGNRVEIVGAGTAWQFPEGCTQEEVQNQAARHIERRDKQGVTTIITTPGRFRDQYPGNLRTLPGNRSSR